MKRNTNPLGAALLAGLLLAGCGDSTLERPLERPAPVAPRAVAPHDPASPRPAPVTPRAREQAAPRPAPRRRQDARQAPGSDWRAALEDERPGRRADAVDRMPRRAEHLPLVVALITSDPDADVRERAVLAYAEIAGGKARPVLRKLALEDRMPRVREAAMASLDLLDRTDPLPPRGTVSISVPTRFAAGAAFSVTVRFKSQVDVPRVRLALSLPRGAEVVSSGGNRWKGALAAGQQQSIQFVLRFTGDPPAQCKVVARLVLDHGEQLDVERLAASAYLRLAGGEGRSVPAPAPRERVIQLAD